MAQTRFVLNMITTDKNGDDHTHTKEKTLTYTATTGLIEKTIAAATPTVLWDTDTAGSVATEFAGDFDAFYFSSDQDTWIELTGDLSANGSDDGNSFLLAASYWLVIFGDETIVGYSDADVLALVGTENAIERIRVENEGTATANIEYQLWT